MKVLKKAFLNIRESFPKMHFGLLILMIAFAIFGLLMIFSASSVAAVLRYGVSTNYFFLKQLIFVVLGFIGGFIIMTVPTKVYRYISKIAMFVMMFLLSFLFVGGIVAGGAQSWYDFGIFNFQPAEFAKPIIIVYLAVYYHKLSSKKKISFFSAIYPLILCAIIFVLIAIQPDFGGAFIIFLIVALIFFAVPIGKAHKRKIFSMIGVGIVVLALSLLLFGKTIFQSYQVSRLLNFANPCQRYTEDSGYQVCNGYIAIHNGGLFGVGLGNSTQKYLYLPEAHTDFIYPIIVEECGLLVGILVVFLYFVMLFIILDIAKKTDNLRNSVLAYGVFGYLLAHILINMLGVLGIIPLTGVPLPFLSYGGSYNLCVILSLFIVQRVNIENRLDRQRRKIENL
ncbi:MAG: FtsW/RodA/SpoVE family cell cycle protein [Bacilli bacterium]|nr:FtsW/RodA/SpoVE family cell cycle protein [Bacilli bacterium]